MKWWSRNICVVLTLTAMVLLGGCGASPPIATPTPVSGAPASAAPALASPSPVPTAAAGAASPQSTLPPTVVPTLAPPAPTATAAVTAAPSTRDFPSLSAGLSKLSSFRYHLLFNETSTDVNNKSNKGAQETTEEDINTSGDQHYRIVNTGDPVSLGGTAFPVNEGYFANNASFSLRDGACAFNSKLLGTAKRRLFIGLLDDFLYSIRGAKLVKQGETVNGFTADHYTFVDATFRPNDQGLQVQQGDVWVAPDGYLVKLTGQARGSPVSYKDKQVQWTFELTGVNDVKPISLPANCTAPTVALDKEILVPENATDETLFDTGRVAFYSPDSMQTVAAFYRKQMPAAGWSELTADEFTGATGMSLRFSKNNNALILFINLQTVPGGSYASASVARR